MAGCGQSSAYNLTVLPQKVCERRSKLSLGVGRHPGWSHSSSGSKANYQVSKARSLGARGYVEGVGRVSAFLPADSEGTQEPA